MLLSRVSEAAGAAGGFVEGVDGLPGDAVDGGDEHLGDAHVAFDGEGVWAEVDEGDHDLASVVGVDGAGGVGHGDAELHGEPGAGADLGFVPDGQSHGEPTGDQGDGAGFEGDGRGGIDRGVEVGGGGVVGLVLGGVDAFAVGQALEEDTDLAIGGVFG